MMFLWTNSTFTLDFLSQTLVILEVANTDEDEVRLEQELHDHLNLADQGYASLRKDCEMCRESWSQVDNRVADN